MARARTKPGTWGKITRKKLTPDGVKPQKWEAATNYRDLDGRLREVTATAPTGPKAETALIEKLTKRHKATQSTGELTPETTIEVLARMWLKKIKESKRWSTYKRYRSVTDGHIVTKLGGLTIDELSAAKMEVFFDNLKSAVGVPTAHLARVCLTGMYNLATRLGAARFGNLVKLTSSIVIGRKPVIALNPQQVKMIRKLLRSDRLACRNAIADIIDVMLGTGARIGEVVVLQWKHLDLDAQVPTLLIEATAAWGDGKGVYAQPYPKGGPQARRRLKLPHWLVLVLRTLRDSAPHDNPDELVFPSRAKTIRHPNNVRTSITEARDRVGLVDLPMNPHTYRKTVGTKIGQKDIEMAAAQLGHASSVTTRRHYVEPAHEGPDARKHLDDFADLS
ncbi:tyrosine-type recombinase/integrase [Nocardia pseudovaccinii]|uniref:tyrosine-type recombinase/integrase n=1 Tax=Nocardia pseudovaccinii TaxID=189540 RepID=UPI0007A3D573|nr:tyrosine-type recombinase/integrase [Nocardia pseudovaccinii]